MSNEEKHKWIRNFKTKNNIFIVVCKCGIEFRGYKEETAQNGFFKHKEQSEKTSK